MDDLHEGLEDAQYLNAMYTSGRPLRSAVECPTNAELQAWYDEFGDDPALVSIPAICTDNLGLFLFLKYCATNGDEGAALFVEGALRVRDLKTKKSRDHAASVMCNDFFAIAPGDQKRGVVDGEDEEAAETERHSSSDAPPTTGADCSKVAAGVPVKDGSSATGSSHAFNSAGVEKKMTAAALPLEKDYNRLPTSEDHLPVGQRTFQFYDHGLKRAMKARPPGAGREAPPVATPELLLSPAEVDAVGRAHLGSAWPPPNPCARHPPPPGLLPRQVDRPPSGLGVGSLFNRGGTRRSAAGSGAGGGLLKGLRSSEPVHPESVRESQSAADAGGPPPLAQLLPPEAAAELAAAVARARRSPLAAAAAGAPAEPVENHLPLLAPAALFEAFTGLDELEFSSDVPPLASFDRGGDCTDLGEMSSESESAGGGSLSVTGQVTERANVHDSGCDSSPDVNPGCKNNTHALDFVEFIVFEYLARKHGPKFLASPLEDPTWSKRANATELSYKAATSTAYLRLLQMKAMRRRPATEVDFTKFRVLGRGGFGLVFGCMHRSTGHMYAMKTMNRKRVKVKRAESLCWDERRILGKLNSQFIVGLSYSFFNREDLFLVMDLMVGGDLNFWLNKKRRFSQIETEYHGGRIFLAMQHMHTHGIMYRDLKPENILMDGSGRTRLSDLGLACAIPKGQKLRGACGTRGYMAPEMLRRDEDGRAKGYDACADWFSLGCVLFELRVGTNPFRTLYAKKWMNINGQHADGKQSTGSTSGERCRGILGGVADGGNADEQAVGQQGQQDQVGGKGGAPKPSGKSQPGLSRKDLIDKAVMEMEVPFPDIENLGPELRKGDRSGRDRSNERSSTERSPQEAAGTHVAGVAASPHCFADRPVDPQAGAAEAKGGGGGGGSSSSSATPTETGLGSEAKAAQDAAEGDSDGHRDLEDKLRGNMLFKDLVMSLLSKNPEERIGNQGAREIADHAWFREYCDLEQLSLNKVEPPMRPGLDINANSQSNIGQFDQDKISSAAAKIKFSREDDDLLRAWNFASNAAFSREVISVLKYEENNIIAASALTKLAAEAELLEGGDVLSAPSGGASVRGLARIISDQGLSLDSGPASSSCEPVGAGSGGEGAAQAQAAGTGAAPGPQAKGEVAFHASADISAGSSNSAAAVCRGAVGVLSDGLGARGDSVGGGRGQPKPPPDDKKKDGCSMC